MQHPKTLVAAGALLLTGGLTACGSADDSTPADAAKADFCKAFSKRSSASV